MAEARIYNLEGKEVGKLDLAPEVFEIKPKSSLLHLAAQGIMANQRQVLAHTKTRGEVRGGGRKPWRQKGTGRARHGSIRSPLWRGGGVIFGPRKDRNFKVKINRKLKKTAMRMVLSDKVENKALLLLENFNLALAKTKIFAALLKKLPLVGKKVLLIFSGQAENFRRAARNLPPVQLGNLNEVNILDFLNNDTVITTKEAVDYWQRVYKN